MKKAADTNRLIFVVSQKDPQIVESDASNLQTVGTICQIKHIFQNESEINVLVSGLSRAKAVRYQNLGSFLVAEIEEVPDLLDTADPEIPALSAHVSSEFQNLIRLGRTFDFFVLLKVTSGLGPAELSNQLAAILDFPPEERQFLLEETNVKTRLKKIADQIAKEIKVVELERKIITSSQAKFDKNVKKNILEERKKAIEQELGEMDEDAKETEDLRSRAKKASMPEDVLKKTLKEIKRLEQMSNMNPEAGYIRNFVDWLLDMPWSVKSENTSDIKAAEKILDEDHYGLEKVKERIIEYLAVLKLKQQKNENNGNGLSSSARSHSSKADSSDAEDESSKNSPKLPNSLLKKKESVPTILCFVGPPGVGKTSIGKSIARALNRKFVRISLGGVRDEAEIRGHRRTYVGALPGRIIQGIKQAGTRNPVFMLDEIDKIGADFRGDPSAALLEALDPEQNNAFSDHYLEVTFDLSEVIFITTANVLDTIPPALLDRLEIIEFPGYTLEEKFHIAKNYLVPKQLEINGLTADQVEFSPEALRSVISRYTYEAGVRNLERELAAVFRKNAKRIAENKSAHQLLVRPSDLHRFLGPYKFTSTIAERRDEVGLSTGLFVTSAGGGILLIEVATMPGKGTLTLTGRLGDVMQESAKAAMSYVRSRWRELGLDEKLFSKIDVHIHFPEGATPKDGPSAGIAITIALASALTKIPVKKFVGMTGEVTLRGRVLEIGGLKEKVIGAKLAGLKTIVAPKSNKKDLEDIPKYVSKDLQFEFVDNMDEVLDLALVSKPQPKTSSAGVHRKTSPQFARLQIPVS